MRIICQQPSGVQAAQQMSVSYSTWKPKEFGASEAEPEPESAPGADEEKPAGDQAPSEGFVFDSASGKQPSALDACCPSPRLLLPGHERTACWQPQVIDCTLAEQRLTEPTGTSRGQVAVIVVMLGTRDPSDAPTGYYWDAFTGYMYDPASQLYYHSSTQQWYKRDAATNEMQLAEGQDPPPAASAASDAAALASAAPSSTGASTAAESAIGAPACLAGASAL